MSDSDDTLGTAQDAGEDSTPDPIKNLKAEMNRKLQNADRQIGTVLQQNQNLSQQLNTVLAQLNRGANAPSASQSKKLEELIQDDPAAAAAEIEAMTERKAARYVDSAVQAERSRNQVLSNLSSQYPELNDASSELHLEASAIFDTFDERFRADPISYETAVLRAAAKHGVMPVQKRKKPTDADADTFTMPRGGSGQTTRTQAPQKVDPKTDAFADIMAEHAGIKDVETYKKNVAKRAQRKNWKTWG